MRVVVKWWMVLVFQGFMLVSVTGAAQQAERFKDWTRSCDALPGGKQACHIVQDVTSKQTGEVVLRAEVGVIPGTRRALLLITVPLGVALRPGLGLQIDSAKPLHLLFDACAPDGCRAATPMNAALINAMKRGAQARVTVTRLNAEHYVVPVSLSGFTKGFGSVTR